MMAVYLSVAIASPSARHKKKPQSLSSTSRGFVSVFQEVSGAYASSGLVVHVYRSISRRENISILSSRIENVFMSKVKIR